ncbi:unnamed protein product [Meloidogyne enterolobii]|uniref:Uncharacterized protein n=1 Tax=Meloidogyne enterolobii TaxID=390850 RepID=A0ACB1AF09_MELEN
MGSKCKICKKKLIDDFEKNKYLISRSPSPFTSPQSSPHFFPPSTPSIPIPKIPPPPPPPQLQILLNLIPPPPIPPQLPPFLNFFPPPPPPPLNFHLLFIFFLLLHHHHNFHLQLFLISLFSSSTTALFKLKIVIYFRYFNLIIFYFIFKLNLINYYVKINSPENNLSLILG